MRVYKRASDRGSFAGWWLAVLLILGCGLLAACDSSPAPKPMPFTGTLTALVTATAIQRVQPAMPSATLQLGLSGECNSPYAYGFDCHSAWQGYRNGYLVIIVVGQQSRNDSKRHDEVHIYTNGNKEIYPIPSWGGTVEIASVAGDILTVAQSPTYETFTFNLLTHEWVFITPHHRASPTVTGTATATHITMPPAKTPTANSTTVATDIPGPTTTPTLDLSKNYGGWPPAGLAYDPTTQAAATAAIQHITAYQTLTALTPSATIAFVPLEIPVPRPTFGVGLITDTRCSPPVHRGEPRIESCWHTTINGTRLLVGTGYEGFGPTETYPNTKGEHVSWRGLLWLCTEPCADPMPEQLFQAPRPDLHITAVNGALVTMQARDPQVATTWTYNITTQQWTPPLPTQSPTPGPPPAPSQSPLPSPSLGPSPLPSPSP